MCGSLILINFLTNRVHYEHDIRKISCLDQLNIVRNQTLNIKTNFSESRKHIKLKTPFTAPKFVMFLS